MNIDSAIRISLWITAPFNLLAGYLFAMPSSFLSQVIGMPGESYTFYSTFSGAMVALYGFGYVWLALQREMNQPLLFLGASGKLLAVLVAWVFFVQEEISGIATLLISGDLAFVSLWFYYLYKRS